MFVCMHVWIDGCVRVYVFLSVTNQKFGDDLQKIWTVCLINNAPFYIVLFELWKGRCEQSSAVPLRISAVIFAVIFLLVPMQSFLVLNAFLSEILTKCRLRIRHPPRLSHCIQISTFSS